MRYIEQRTFELTRYLATRMLKLRHDAQRAEQNKPGYPLCTIFGRHDEADVTSSVQGKILLFRTIKILLFASLCNKHWEVLPVTRVAFWLFVYAFFLWYLIGPVIAFTLQWANGTPIGFSEVGRLAAEQGIQLRTGMYHSKLEFSRSYVRSF